MTSLPLEKPPAPTEVIFAHVSDIHFHKKLLGGDLYTLDDDVRNEMLRDLSLMRKQHGVVHAILVTGDVAFSGDATEYREADAWLKEACRQTGCPEEMVRVIPGNHDVRRAAIKQSAHIRDAHKSLRKLGAQSNFPQIDEDIGAYLRDAAAPDLLYKSIEEYNKFASKYLSNFDHAQPFWTFDILMNDQSTLRLRGLNSALISGEEDNLGDNKLVVGGMFSTVKREDGIVHMVLCHHPPQWIWDQDPIETYLNTRVRIQLFGHKHVQKIHEQNHSGFVSLRLHAGALNPEQNAGEYLPRYNIISIRVEIKENQRNLIVNVHSRAWDANATKFDDAAKAHHTSTIALEQWTPDDIKTDTLLPTEISIDPLKISSDPLHVNGADEITNITLTAIRRLAYRFLSLSYARQLEVAMTLKLVEDSDKGLSEIELLQRVLRRAQERAQLSEMWTAVETFHDGNPKTTNPFDN